MHLTLERDALLTSDGHPEPDEWIPAGYFVPDFAQRLGQALDRLATLPANWDAQGALPIAADVLAAARDLVRQWPENLAEVPLVVPMAKGNLQFEWHDGPRSLELEIESPRRIHYLKWHPEEGIEEEGFYPLADVGRSVNLIRWFRRSVLNA